MHVLYWLTQKVYGSISWVKFVKILILLYYLNIIKDALYLSSIVFIDFMCFYGELWCGYLHKRKYTGSIRKYTKQ